MLDQKNSPHTAGHNPKNANVIVASGADKSSDQQLIISWSEIEDRYAKIVERRTATWGGFIDRLRTAGSFPDKASCPWLKLATFGDKRTESGSLRHDANVLDICGVELDYDGGIISIEQARDRLEKFGIRAALYPSPSSTAEKPRWRVLAPTSQKHPPAARSGFVGRLNGVLGGIGASESFTLSQGFFFGATPNNDYRVMLTFDDPEDGTCIDLVPELDEIAIGKQQTAKPDAPSKPAGPVSLNIFDDAVARLGRKLKSGDGRRELLKTYIASRSARGLPADDIRMIVAGVAAQYFDQSDPIDENNINQIIQHFTRKDWRPEVDTTGLLGQRIDPATGEILPAAWPEPQPITSSLPPAPEFDAGVLLPKALADFVLDEADRMPCSPDYVAASLIVCLGSVIGATCALKPKRRDDWIVVPNLWGGIVGDPSSKKSPALSTTTRFLDRLEAREAEKLAEALKVYEAEMAAYEALEDAIKKSMRKAASGKADDTKMATAVDDLKAMVPPAKPHARRYKSNDASIEKLCDIESRNPQGLMVFRDELVGLLASWEREGHEGDRAYYLEGWNGTGSYNSDRIGRGEQFVKNHCLSILGGIQPDKMETYLSGIAANLDNDGRVQRFQVLVYPEAVPWQWRDRYPVKGAREAVRDMFDRLSTFDPVLDGATPADDFVKLPHFTFGDDAQEIFIEWCTDLNLKQIASEPDPMMRQHLGKFEKLFCSLALILHLAEGNIGPVKADSALRAAAWCDYLAAHARRIYSMVEGAKVATAKMLLRRITEGKLQPGFTVRTVRQKNWTGATETIQIESALAMLEAHHYIRASESAGNGRPTTTYQINPALIGGAA